MLYLEKDAWTKTQAQALNQQAKQLLVADDLPEQMAKLSPLVAHFIIKEIGLGDALPLLQHTTPEQRQACIDLNCWDDDTLNHQELDAWLASFAADGPQSLGDAFLQLDENLQILFLANLLHIYDARDAAETPVINEELPYMTTADGLFVLQPRDIDEREIGGFDLVQAIYLSDAYEAMRILMAAKWEVPALIEEEAFHWRSGRLEDLGFPTLQDAAQLYAKPLPLPKTPWKVGLLPTQLPYLYTRVLDNQSLFNQAANSIADISFIPAIESMLIHIINAAMVAIGQSPRDLAQVERIAKEVHNTLCLGLETLVGQTHADLLPNTPAMVQAAADKLTTYPLRTIFQHGHQQVLPLQRAAQKLIQEPLFNQWHQLLASRLNEHNSEPEQALSADVADLAFVQALAQRRPLHAGFELYNPNKTVAFASHAALQKASQRLQTLQQRWQIPL